MVKEKQILAIDVGEESIKMAEFRTSPEQNGLTLTGYLIRPFIKLEEEENAEAFSRIYYEMLAEGGFTAVDVRLAVSANNIFQRLNKLPSSGTQTSIAKLVEYESAQSLPYALEEVEWDFQLLTHRWETQETITDDEGNENQVATNHEEMEAYFVAIKTEDLSILTDVIEDSGKNLISVEPSPVSIFNAALATQVKPEETVLLLNIGAKGSSMMLSDQRRIFFRNIPIGGNSLTAQIAKEFSMSEKDAEDFKRRYGFVALGGAVEEADSEVAATISKLARAVMTRLHNELTRSVGVWRSQYDGNAPTRMLLCGGGSIMQYTTDFFHEKLHKPVEYLNAFGALKYADGLDLKQLQDNAQTFQSIIGLGLHEIGNCPVTINLLPKAIKKQLDLNRRLPYFYLSMVTLLICLGLVCIGVFSQIHIEEGRTGSTEVQLKSAKEKSDKVMKLKSELDGLVNSYSDGVKYLRERNSFAKLVAVIEKAMPDRVWLVAFELDGDEKIQADDKGGGMDMMLDEDFGPGRGAVSADGKPAAAVRATPNKRKTAKDFSNLKSINRIRLAGYTLDEPLLLNFRKNLERASVKVNGEETPIFERVTPKFLTQASESNLNYFEVVLTLKEPLKK